MPGGAVPGLVGTPRLGTDGAMRAGLAAAAIDEDAVNNPANPDVPADIASEVEAASAEYDAEKAFMDANANTPTA